MEYMTVAEAASKWSVSPRQVQRFLSDNRIADAKKYGRAWMIPTDAQKPVDVRRAQDAIQDIFLQDFKEELKKTTIPMPFNDPDAIMESLDDELISLEYEAEIAYLRGDFERTIRCFKKLSADEVAKFRACSVAIAAAISLGDYQTYSEIESYLKTLIEKDEWVEVTSFAESSLSTAYVSTFATKMVPAWLKDGDLSTVPLEARPDALYKRAKYFQCISRYESMLAVAQSALSLCDSNEGITFPSLYLKTACALACCCLERIDDAQKYLREVIDLCLPHGFITPLAESVSIFGPLLEQCLEEKYPEYIKIIYAQWTTVFKNWIIFHNRFTQDNITDILSLREYQIATLVAIRTPYVKIAEIHNISVGRLKNIVQEIYRKLFVSSRNELKEYIIWKE